jgi:hypothetical protein
MGEKFLDLLKRIAMTLLFNDETKQAILDELNKQIDIPFVSEDTEAELYELIYESVESALKGVLGVEGN